MYLAFNESHFKAKTSSRSLNEKLNIKYTTNYMETEFSFVLF